MMNLHFLDIAAMVILLIGFIRGMRVGIVGSALALLGMVLGVYLAVQLHHEVALWLKDQWGALGKWQGGVAFLLVFIGVLILFHFLVGLLTRLLDATPLGIMNRLAGALFFMGGMAVVTGSLAWGLVQYGWLEPAVYADTILFEKMVRLGQWAVTQAVESGFFDRMEQLWKDISVAVQSTSP